MPRSSPLAVNKKFFNKPSIAKPARRFTLHLALLLILFPSLASAQNNSAKTDIKQSWQLAGLQSKAQILVDNWGVPHIYAENEADLFFAQGFNVARDRLFQIDLWRRRGLGQLAEVFGSSYIEQDKAARAFLYRGDMELEWAAYGTQAQTLSKSFVAGINAYIDYLSRNPEGLPPEFKVMQYQPAKWQVEDVVRIRSHGLTRNLTSEVARARLACTGNLALDEVRQSLSHGWKTKVPAGLDPCLPDDVLRQFTLATQNVTFDANSKRVSQTVQPTLLTMQVNDSPLETQEGSNNWVIAPAKSGTGRAIMANDPHRAYSTPSLRYITHLSAPGLDVIGAGEPALPGISIGHNGNISFGLTIMAIDQEDLYVYELNPANPQQYKYQGKWENFTQHNETFKIKGQADQQVDLPFTRHGPVIYIESDKNRAFAVRTAWLQAGMAPYFGSVEYMRANNFLQFKKAMQHWGAPTLNQVYADTKGNIGWAPGGMTPIRNNWDGLLPVPGDGRYEWSGFLSGDKLPSSYNPRSAWFASANEMNLPNNYPQKNRKLGFEWPLPARYSRIAEVLGQNRKISIEDSMLLQNDVFSLPAKRLVSLTSRLKTDDVTQQKALAVFKNWDYFEHADSPAAALFQVWLTQTLAPAYKNIMLGSQAGLVTSMPDMTRMLQHLESVNHLPAQFGSTSEIAGATRDDLLLSSLSLAYQGLERLQGKDSKHWRWGKLQKTPFKHAMSAIVDANTRAQFDVGNLPRGGSAHTVNQSSYRLQDFVQLNGPSFRVVIDVGNWDNSRAINTPGQSGDPASPHYRDLAELWVKGDYFPLLYSRKAVEENTRQRFDLLPAK